MRLILFFSLQSIGFDAFSLNSVVEHNMYYCSAFGATLQPMHGGQQLSIGKHQMNWLTSLRTTTNGGHGSLVVEMVRS